MDKINGNSMVEPVTSVEPKTLPCLHPSVIDKSLHENHGFKPMGTNTYKYLKNIQHSIPSSKLC